MKIFVSPISGIPIYEQIKNQIKEQVLSGGISPNTALPSIRTLAKELQVGIVTAKRAYDDLCAEGYAYAVQGKGVYISPVNSAQIEEFNLAEIELRLREIYEYAKTNSVSTERVKKIIKQIWGE